MRYISQHVSELYVKSKLLNCLALTHGIDGWRLKSELFANGARITMSNGKVDYAFLTVGDPDERGACGGAQTVIKSYQYHGVNILELKQKFGQMTVDRAAINVGENSGIVERTRKHIGKSKMPVQSCHNHDTMNGFKDVVVAKDGPSPLCHKTVDIFNDWCVFINAGERFKDYEDSCKELKDELIKLKQNNNDNNVICVLIDTPINRPGSVSRTRMANHFFNVTDRFMYQFVFIIYHCHKMKTNMKVRKDERNWYEMMYERVTHLPTALSCAFVSDLSRIWKEVDLLLERKDMVTTDMGYVKLHAHSCFDELKSKDGTWERILKHLINVSPIPQPNENNDGNINDDSNDDIDQDDNNNNNDSHGDNENSNNQENSNNNQENNNNNYDSDDDININSDNENDNVANNGSSNNNANSDSSSDHTEEKKGNSYVKKTNEYKIYKYKLSTKSQRKIYNLRSVSNSKIAPWEKQRQKLIQESVKKFDEKIADSPLPPLIPPLLATNWFTLEMSRNDIINDSGKKELKKLCEFYEVESELANNEFKKLKSLIFAKCMPQSAPNNVKTTLEFILNQKDYDFPSLKLIYALLLSSVPHLMWIEQFNSQLEMLTDAKRTGTTADTLTDKMNIKFNAPNLDIFDIRYLVARYTIKMARQVDMDPRALQQLVFKDLLSTANENELVERNRRRKEHEALKFFKLIDNE